MMQDKLFYRMGTLLFMVAMILLNSMGFQVGIDGAIIITLVELGLTSHLFWNTDCDKKGKKYTAEKGEQ